MQKNRVGLEAEFFLRDKDGQILYPDEYNFSTDDFCVLGEFRADSGETREATIANFMKKYYEVVYKARNHSKGLILDIENGWAKVDPKFYASVLRKMGSKSVAQCFNIYDTDILSLTDAETKGGKIVSQKLSIGLHIHFSSSEVNERKVTIDSYESVKLPLSLGKASASFDLYRKTGSSYEEKVEAKASKISKPVVKHIVQELDKNLLKTFTSGMPTLKYRNPGFYEYKQWGFEYRSLPFNRNVLNKIDEIVDFSFKLLEEL